MKVGIILNINGKGLQLDGELLSAFLAELGHESTFVQFDQPCDLRFDLAISLEIVNEAHFSIAPRSVWCPNLEWCKNEYLCHAKRFDRIWAKTLDAESVLRDKFPHVTYTGFLSRDRNLPDVHRERRFLHVGGDSGLKNTNAVIAAWRQWRYWTGTEESGLTVVSRSIQTDVFDTTGVTFLREVSDSELQQLQNSHLFHLQPSAYEGWGHALRESQSVGAVLLTTQAGPMLEMKAPFEVAPIMAKKVNMAMTYAVSGREIREKVGVMLEQPSQMVAKYQVNARARWMVDLKGARERLGEAVGAFTRPVTQVVVPSAPIAHIETSRVVAIWGNLRPEFSTENEWAHSFRSLGWDVVCFQEDEFPTEQIVPKCLDEGVSLLLYIHTHSFDSPGKLAPIKVVESLRTHGIKTVAPHLDLFFGLHGDRRDEKVGKHASWKVDYCMTADGSFESSKKFRERGVNHVWMKPGVNAEACYFGKPQRELEDIWIGFTGQRSYHSEWPWRADMVEFLEANYEKRFQVFTGYRGDALNNLYASIPIWIGDCCFAGRPRYWSDRASESCGRGAFLIHPQVQGFCIPTATYMPEDTIDLCDKIDYYLEHPDERALIRDAAQKHVASHDTYVHRAQQILETVGYAGR